MRLGNSSIFKQKGKIDTIFTNTYKFIIYETKSNQTAHNFYALLNATFPDITLMNQTLDSKTGWIVTGTFPRGCVSVKDSYADKI
jgi:hypothetical protein